MKIRFAMLAMSIVLVLSLLDASANAPQRRDGSYLCAEKFGAGLAYNEKTKKWEGTQLRPELKFILELKFVREGRWRPSEKYGDISTEGFEYDYAEYEASVTEAGKNAFTCNGSTSEEARLDDAEFMNCRANLDDYQFNFQTNRFLRAYLVGYVGGADNKDDTPSVSGGVCTKIK